MARKKKILALTDHPFGTSGVGVQARMLMEGLIKTGNYTFRVLGGALKHENYETVAINEDLIVKPVDGFGTREQLRQLLITERPDAVFIFTDPRQFIWLWEVEDEIKQICPIVYWHVWDNDPYPAFNKVWYEGTELINCLSHKTYELVKPHFPDKTNYIPHAFPKEVYFPIQKDQLEILKVNHFNEKKDWFKVLWVNRNAHRKMPNDLIQSWKVFLDELQEKEGHRNACLIMHTDPLDQEGPNLQAVCQLFGVEQHVWFSNQRTDFGKMNVLHNLVDCCVSISKAEGFGLSTLISLQVGKPIIALKTGGMTRQVVDYRDGTEYGVVIEPAERCLIGSQMTPYIHEDIVDKKALVAGFWKMYKMSPEDREAIGKKGMEYVDHEFNYDKMVSEWDRTLSECITNFKTNKPKQWQLIQLGGEELVMPPQPQQESMAKINQPRQKK